MKNTKDILEMIREYHKEQLIRKSNIVLSKIYLNSFYGMYVDTDMKISVKKTILTSIIMCSISSIYVEGGEY